MSIYQEIKDRLDILDVIQEYFPLQKTGSSYKALCPFHREKTPSFMVSPSKQIWKCFGCGRGGDIFKFIQEIEGIDFGTALKILAEKAGVKLTRINSKISTHNTRVLEALDLATKYYQESLKKNKYALEYLKYRGLDKNTILDFKLGYSGSWEGVILYLKNKGYSEKEILDTGIAVKREDGSLYDRFKGRLIFPILNIYGQIIGFGGRILEDREGVAKYINTPNTIFYNKSKVLYGIDKAKLMIKDKGFVILVEGYMDTISSHRIGIKNVVACSGTSLTNYQLKILSRYTKTIVLCFDFDPAGIKALIRSLELAWELGFNIKVIALEKGKDPDDIIRENYKKWINLCSNPISFLEYLIEIIKKTNLEKLENKKNAAERMAEILSKFKNPVEKSHYISKLSKILDVKEDAIWELVLSKSKESSYKNQSITDKKEIVNVFMKDKMEIAFEKIFSIILRYPQLIEDKKFNIFKLPILESRKLTNSNGFELYLLLKNFYNTHNYIDIDEFKIGLDEKNQQLLETYLLLFDKDYGDLDIDQIKKDFILLYKSLAKDLYKEKIGYILKLLKKAENEMDNESIKEYLKELSYLNKRIKLFNS